MNPNTNLETLDTGITSDERMILPTGKGRDIGRNPAFSPRRPTTRQDTRALPNLLSVGDGSENETINTLAGRAINFPLYWGIDDVSASGSGSFLGFSIVARSDAGEWFVLEIYSRRTGTVLMPIHVDTAVANRYVYNTGYIGPWGVGYNDLAVRIANVGSLTQEDIPSIAWSATVWISDTE